MRTSLSQFDNKSLSDQNSCVSICLDDVYSFKYKQLSSDLVEMRDSRTFDERHTVCLHTKYTYKIFTEQRLPNKFSNNNLFVFASS